MKTFFAVLAVAVLLAACSSPTKVEPRTAVTVMVKGWPNFNVDTNGVSAGRSIDGEFLISCHTGDRIKAVTDTVADSSNIPPRHYYYMTDAIVSSKWTTWTDYGHTISALYLAVATIVFLGDY